MRIIKLAGLVWQRELMEELHRHKLTFKFIPGKSGAVESTFEVEGVTIGEILSIEQAIDNGAGHWITMTRQRMEPQAQKLLQGKTVAAWDECPKGFRGED